MVFSIQVRSRLFVAQDLAFELHADIHFQATIFSFRLLVHVHDLYNITRCQRTSCPSQSCTYILTFAL